MAQNARRARRLSQQNEVLDMLLAASDDFEVKYESNMNLYRELAAERQELQERAQVLQQRYQEQLEEQYELERHQDVQSGNVKNVSGHLENLYSLLGYRMTDCQDFGNEGAKQITLNYNEYCCLKFSVGKSYDLLHIQPEHPNFAQIKQFLRDTQDLPGLLANVQKYFELIIKLKQEAP